MRYLASNANVPVELIGTLTRRANENLVKQNEVGVKKFIDAMVSIAIGWEKEDETTVVPSTQPTTLTTQEVSTTSQETTLSSTEATSTETSTLPISTTVSTTIPTVSSTEQPDDESTTLGASSLSIQYSMLFMLLIVARILI